MMRFPKHKYIRSEKLRRLVASLDCQLCGGNQVIQAAHTNWGAGKGKGIKADDNMIAALCMHCHSEIDQGNKWTKVERQRAWWTAHRKTVETLVEDGRWPIDIPIPDGTEWTGFIDLQ
jgi:transcription elongation factor Elf1